MQQAHFQTDTEGFYSSSCTPHAAHPSPSKDSGQSAQSTAEWISNTNSSNLHTYPNMDHGSDGLWPHTQHTERAERMPETQKHRDSVKSQGKWNLAVYLHFPALRLILFLKSLCEGGMPVLSKVFSLWKFKM